MNEVKCPKCEAIFVCLSTDIMNCQCNSIKINEKALKFIKEEFLGCLCKNCLEEIGAKFQ